MKAAYLVCYDITLPRRLSRVLKLMKGSGIHLQYSVFYCKLSWPQLQQLKTALSALIEPAEDDIRIYPLPAAGEVVSMGRGDKIPKGVEIFLPGEGGD